MAGIKFSRLAEQFITHLEIGGATVLVRGAYERRPLQCHVTLGDRKWDLEVYLWAVTPGGKGRNRPDERRIQMTGVNRFAIRPGVQPVVGGWSEEVGVYAFWDVRRHLGFTAGSPSLQMPLEKLRQAHHSGMAAETRKVREGVEIGMAVQPDYLLWYLEQWNSIFECDVDIDNAASLIDASLEEAREFVDSGRDEKEQRRRDKVVTIVRNFRDARFRPTVLRAYGFRCCITDIALRLVEAAHIIPVSDPRSTDDIWNGVALSANHHRAYDSGLLGILPGGKISINNRVANKLRKDRLHAGIEGFMRDLPPRISLPCSTELYPSDDALRRGLEIRGWSDTEIRSA